MIIVELTYNNNLLRMGSGISISNQQAIEIVRRELNRAFTEADSNRRLVDDYGMLLPETFDEEEQYINNLKRLQTMERALDAHSLK